jgi:hypothetical protein
MGKLTVECDVGNVSDGYHTFNELYAHRCVLFTALMKAHKDISWVSKLHSDGTMFDGWFVAGMNLSTGMVTYHLPIEPFWNRVSDLVELEFAPEWDGHTSVDVINRFVDWLGWTNE